jgi:hypothetical protein
MSDERDLQRLMQPRSARWRPGIAVIFAVAVPTVVIFVFLQWTVRALKIEPENWQMAVVGVLLLLAGMIGLAITSVLLALAWLRR